DRDAVPQKLKLAGEGLGAMAYWNSHVYFGPHNDTLREYSIANGKLTPHLSAAGKFEMGVTPSVSANGNKDAIVWAISTKVWDGPDDRPAVLYAYDATKLGPPLYTSEQNAARDRAGMAVRFVIPVVVSGRVYVGTRSEVDVYGLLK